MSGGTGENQTSPDKKKEDLSKKKRHKVTFLDEVTDDKSALTDIHFIESYKKYNQEFYSEN